MEGTLKEAQKRLQKAEKNLKVTNDERDELKKKFDFMEEQFGKLQKEHTELKSMYQLSSENTDMLTKQNAGYRGAIVSNETQMETYANEVNELRKTMTITRSEIDRMKEENAAYKKQNQKLVDELKAQEEDVNDQRDIGNRNDKTLQLYIGGDVDQLKEKVKTLQNSFVSTRKENDAALAAKD